MTSDLVPYLGPDGLGICMTARDNLNFIDAICDLKSSGLFVQHVSVPAKSIEDVKLCEGAQAVLDCPNAGGNSEMSEAMSFEVFRRYFGAKLEKTEMSIEYEWSISKKTDYLCSIFKRKFGVSVTRAMSFRKPFDVNDGIRLLSKKLHGVNMSSRDVVDNDRWTKQILHIWAKDDATVDALIQAHKKMDPSLLSNTVVVVSVTKNTGSFIFTNKPQL